MLKEALLKEIQSKPKLKKLNITGSIYKNQGDASTSTSTNQVDTNTPENNTQESKQKPVHELIQTIEERERVKSSNPATPSTKQTKQSVSNKGNTTVTPSTEQSVSNKGDKSTPSSNQGRSNEGDTTVTPSTEQSVSNKEGESKDWFYIGILYGGYFQCSIGIQKTEIPTEYSDKEYDTQIKEFKRQKDNHTIKVKDIKKALYDVLLKVLESEEGIDKNVTEANYKNQILEDDGTITTNYNENNNKCSNKRVKKKFQFNRTDEKNPSAVDNIYNDNFNNNKSINLGIIYNGYYNLKVLKLENDSIESTIEEKEMEKKVEGKTKEKPFGLTSVNYEENSKGNSKSNTKTVNINDYKKCIYDLLDLLGFKIEFLGNYKILELNYGLKLKNGNYSNNCNNLNKLSKLINKFNDTKSLLLKDEDTLKSLTKSDTKPDEYYFFTHHNKDNAPNNDIKISEFINKIGKFINNISDESKQSIEIVINSYKYLILDFKQKFTGKNQYLCIEQLNLLAKSYSNSDNDISDLIAEYFSIYLDDYVRFYDSISGSSTTNSGSDSSNSTSGGEYNKSEKKQKTIGKKQKTIGNKQKTIGNKQKTIKKYPNKKTITSKRDKNGSRNK